MGVGAARRYDGSVGRYFTSRCIGLHVTLLVLLPVFAWLTKWQLDRALGGNTLSWAYTFEWPLFAGYAVYVWWQLIHDQPTAVVQADGAGPGGRRRVGSGLSPTRVGTERWPRQERGHRRRQSHRRGDRWPGERFHQQTPDEAARLAAYNRYLADLNSADAEPSH